MALLSETHCHWALRAGTSKVTIWSSKQAIRTLLPGKEGEGQVAPGSQLCLLKPLDSSCLKIAPWYTLLSCSTDRGSWHISELLWRAVQSLEPWISSRRNDLELLLHDKQACFSVPPHPTHITYTQEILPCPISCHRHGWLLSWSNNNIVSPYYGLPGFLKSLPIHCRKLLHGKCVYQCRPWCAAKGKIFKNGKILTFTMNIAWTHVKNFM